MMIDWTDYSIKLMWVYSYISCLGGLFYLSGSEEARKYVNQRTLHKLYQCAQFADKLFLPEGKYIINILLPLDG